MGAQEQFPSEHFCAHAGRRCTCQVFAGCSMSRENDRRFFAVRGADRESVEDVDRRERFIEEYQQKVRDLLSGKVSRAYFLAHAKEGTRRPIPLQWKVPWF